MAGDWLKIEKHTPDKPEIMAIATILDITVEEAFGRCFRVWCWADSQTEDGYVQRISAKCIDGLAGLAGFSDALLEVGWLHVRSGSLQLPNFDRHMGQSAKTRALTANRVARHSKKKGECATNGDGVSSSSLLFSEKGGSKTEALGGRDPPRRFVAPTVDEVRAYCAERAIKIDAAYFVDYYTANGWVQGRQAKPIKDWRAAVRNWERNEKSIGKPTPPPPPTITREEAAAKTAQAMEALKSRLPPPATG